MFLYKFMYKPALLRQVSKWLPTLNERTGTMYFIHTPFETRAIKLVLAYCLLNSTV